MEQKTTTIVCKYFKNDLNYKNSCSDCDYEINKNASDFCRRLWMTWPGTTDFGSDDSTSDKKKIYFNLVLWSNFQDDFA